ncbi:MAG: sigma-54-dependent Fis family transcriptional regulator [Planctomycetes bacterium]|nr:sigma-54-dependent Fis family transcriptional regulator [Planctomycetota bacterium]
MAQPLLGRILVVDDEIDLAESLESNLSRRNYEVSVTTSPEEGLKLIERGNFDLLLSDLMMPGMNGIDLLRKALEIDPQLVGIIMTGQATVQTAIDAMKAGAFDYLLKPFKSDQVVPVLGRAMEVRRLRTENVRLHQYVARLTFESARYQMIGISPGMRQITQLIQKVAPTDSTVLIRGDTGTGKELVARALHYNSPRAKKALVTINCAALQENLLESELFGHEKGSFTGATHAKHGLIEVAEGGTLFVDEIAEMSPTMQAKLLRVLEDGSYRRLGSTQEHHADVRIIAATNKPLEEEQKSGRFREDLYYRLNVVAIALPPLRERREDIPLLIDHFLTIRQMGQRKYQVHPDALDIMMRYPWPGNIRELVNVLERAQILAEEHTITMDDLPANMIVHPTATTRSPPLEASETGPLQLEAMERNHVRSILEQFKFNKVHAAKALGISRRALYRLIAKYDLDGRHGEGETPAE